MFQPENFQSSWSYSRDMTSLREDDNLEYGFGMVPDMGSHEFSFLDTTPEASTDYSFSIQHLENVFSDEHVDFQVDEPSTVTLSTNEYSPDIEEQHSMLTDEIDGMILFNEEDEIYFHVQYSPHDGEDECNLNQSMSTSNTSMDMISSQEPLLTLPTEGMEVDNQQNLLHLLLAYGEAVENGQRELAGVIAERISQKVSPVGNIMERLLYYFFSSLDRKMDYLKVESNKNFHAAFKAFNQIFPYGKFAHFAADSAILKAMPNHANIIHIFDFDMGDGVQWSSMIEAFGGQQRELRLTSIKWSEGDSSCNSQEWKFDETKRRLQDHARFFNVKLKVDEIRLQDLIKMKRRVEEEAWCAFNCMVSLPHMGRVRSGNDVFEFLRVATDFLTSTSKYKGIITFGDGDAWEKLKVSSSFTSFLDGNLMHFQALLESLECSFPVHLGQARTAMESLFVAPFVSSHEWIQKWEETKECCDVLQSSVIGLEGLKVSKENLMEAKEMVREGESLYGVRIEGEQSNQMVLDWRGTPLVKLSFWHN